MRELLPHGKRVITVSAILFLGCLVGLIVYVHTSQTDTFWKYQQERLYGDSEDAQNRTEDWVTEKTTALNAVALEAKSGSLKTSADCEAVLADVEKWNSGVINVLVCYPQGVSGQGDAIAARAAGTDTQNLMQAALSLQGGVFFTEPHYDSNAKAIAFFIAQKTTDATGRTCVVAVEVSLRDLNGELSHDDVLSLEGMNIVSKEGKILYSTDELLLPVVVDGQAVFAYAWDRLSQVTTLEEVNTFAEEGVYIRRIVDYDGVEKYEALAAIGSAGWTLQTNTPLSEHDKELNELWVKQVPVIVLAVVMSLLCCVAAAVLILREGKARKEQAALLEEMGEDNQRLSLLSNYDTLTEVHNRRYLLSYMEKRLAHYDRRNPFSILMLDLDHFKNVNDEHGHSMGDEVLKALTDEIRKTLRVDDVFARHGGEEFIVVLESVHLEQAFKIAERIRRRIEDLEIKGAIKVTVSIGVVEAQEGEAMYDILDRVDVCMYHAKSSGRNRTFREDQGM